MIGDLLFFLAGVGFLPAVGWWRRRRKARLRASTGKFVNAFKSQDLTSPAERARLARKRDDYPSF